MPWHRASPKMTQTGPACMTFFVARGVLTRVYVRCMLVRMMKRTNIYLDPAQLKLLKKIGKPEGLKVAQVIRRAIGQFIEREVGRKKVGKE